MFLEIENPPRMNSRFVVRLAFDTPLFLACVVRRLVPGVGVGVSLSVPARMRRRFDGLMQALASGGDSAGHGAEMPPPPAPHKVRAMAAGM